jgi:chromate reductase
MSYKKYMMRHIMTNTSLEVLRIVAVPGSGRAGSLNRALLDAAVELAPDGVGIEVFDGFADIPVFNEDLESATPAAVVELRTMLAAAHGVLIATPEYNQSIPGGVKNLIDWLSRSDPVQGLSGRPVAVTGVTSGPWGTRIAQTVLRQILLSSGSLVLPGPQLFVANGKSAFDDNGMMIDLDLRSRLENLVTSFADWIRLVGITQT